MKKIIPLSLFTVALLGAHEVTLEQIGVEATSLTEVSKKAKKSADVAEALSQTVPSIDMSRRSGIANDIFIRGQKRDNIAVEVDGTKVCGACPNRMDPPVSHVLASQIEEIEVIEGPYDVETFGTMSGGVKITTKKPLAKPSAEINVGMGAWGYNKIGATVSGGNDFVRALVSVSRENSDQYEDGNGDTLAQQVEKSKAPNGNKYQSIYKDEDAYTKKSIMTKLFVNPLEDHELRLSYTANRSDNVLYANTPMDAVYDDSNIYSIEYNIDNLSNVYKNVNLQYYYSDVDHPMDNKFRNSGASQYTTNHLKTEMQGVKLKNNFRFNDLDVLVGLDGSSRMWKGRKFKTDTATGVEVSTVGISAKTETDNMAVFTKLKQSFGDLDLEIGARYDSTEIETVNKPSQDYDGFNANIMTKYNLDKSNQIFLGIGQAYRVPDARELGFDSSKKLEQTKNQEIDLGYKIKTSSLDFKLKGFYSMLSDYIYYKKSDGSFNNIDATVYGAELSASYYATNELSLDAGLSYKVGEKDKALVGQTDKDLADMAPLRGSLALNYEYAPQSLVKLEMQASDRWDTFDSENGEQALDAWTTLNAKVKHAFNKHIDLTLGVNNITDETYAQSNTYYDLTLVSAGAEQVMLLNDPGRYVYTNLDIKF